MRKKKGNTKSPQERLRTELEVLNIGCILDILRKHDIDVHERGNNGETFLHSVFKNARTRKLKFKTIMEILTIFLDLGISIEAKNKREETVLHLAVINRFEEIVDFLIEHSADVNVINAQGDYIGHYLVRDEFFRCKQTPLKSTMALESRILWEKRTEKFIDFLWSKGFDFDCKNNEGLSPLFLAIKYNLQHILPTLIKYTNDIQYIDEKGCTLLLSYLRVNAWIEDYTERPMLTYDFYNGRYVLSIMQAFLDKGVPIDVADKKGMTALKYSYTQKNWEIVQLLVERVVENESKYLTKFLHHVIKIPIFHICDPSESFLAILVSKTKNFHNELIFGYTVIQLAVVERRLDVIRMLNINEVQFDVLTEDGRNLLHLLSQHIENEASKTYSEKDEELVDYLVSRGCDVNATNGIRQSPLHEAAANGKVTIVEKLIEHGADVNMRRDVLKWTPLHFAADNDEPIEIAELLIANGADVNLKDTCGRTPLHLSLQNSGKLTKLLLSSGAQADVQDRRKFTPLMLAMSRKYLKEVEELLKYGANFYDSESNLCHFSHYMDNDTIERRPILDYILLSHWIKLKAADLPCPVGFRRRAEECAIFRRYYNECREEIERLKECFIDERVSFLNFLQMDPNRRCSYLGNEKIRNFVQFPRADLFPKYANLILASYHEASARKPMLSSAVVGWFTLTNIMLPDICVDRILAYLSNATLLNLIND